MTPQADRDQTEVAVEYNNYNIHNNVNNNNTALSCSYKCLVIPGRLVELNMLVGGFKWNSEHKLSYENLKSQLQHYQSTAASLYCGHFELYHSKLRITAYFDYICTCFWAFCSRMSSPGGIQGLAYVSNTHSVAELPFSTLHIFSLWIFHALLVTKLSVPERRLPPLWEASGCSSAALSAFAADWALPRSWPSHEPHCAVRRETEEAHTSGVQRSFTKCRRTQRQRGMS